MSNITFFFILVSIVAVLFLIINLILAPHNPYQEKYSIFECGFHSFQQTRLPFNIMFFVYGLIYLLLDLEILLIFPFALSEYINSAYGLGIALLFIFVITIGFVFELGKGALLIESKQELIEKGIESFYTINFIGRIFLISVRKYIYNIT